MKQEWGESGGSWPSRVPWGLIQAAALAGVVFVGAGWWHYQRHFTLLQYQYLLGTYTWAAHVPWPKSSYRLVMVAEGKKRRPMVHRDHFDADLKQRGGELVWSAPARYDNAKLGAWLRQDIYEGRSPWATLASAAQWPAAFALALGLTWGIPKDLERWRIRQKGRRLRGPEIVTTAVFNKRNRSNGIGFPNLNQRSLWDRLRRRLPFLRIPYLREAMHMLLMGDSGMGKSTLVRWLLVQIEARGEAAIVYDPALEYVPRFYRPERGDIILNPFDKRMPYWSPGDEVRHEAEAATVAASLFPEQYENKFFVQSPRKLFARLLAFKPSPQELIDWLCQPEKIDERLKDTELAVMVAHEAGAQRMGVLASLNMVVDALKLLPPREETKASWSSLSWAKERKGWIFLAAPPDCREVARPLLSLWLDLLVLRLMGQEWKPGQPRTWFVLDELASLQRLPQLHTAVTENRKSGNPVVLSFQGRSQLEARYGLDAEAVLSQPDVKVFLRTSEASGAKWISDTLGEVEMERLRENRSHGEPVQRRNTQGHQLDRHVEPLVLPSQVAGLSEFNGYLKSGNLVVPLCFEYLDLPCVQERFIPREAPPMPVIPSKPPAFFK